MHETLGREGVLLVNIPILQRKTESEAAVLTPLSPRKQGLMEEAVVRLSLKVVWVLRTRTGREGSFSVLTLS